MERQAAEENFVFLCGRQWSGINERRTKQPNAARQAKGPTTPIPLIAGGAGSPAINWSWVGRAECLFFNYGLEASPLTSCSISFRLGLAQQSAIEIQLLLRRRCTRHTPTHFSLGAQPKEKRESWLG